MSMAMQVKLMELERRLEQHDVRLAAAEGTPRTLPPSLSKPIAEAQAFLREVHSVLLSPWSSSLGAPSASRGSSSRARDASARLREPIRTELPPQSGTSRGSGKRSPVHVTTGHPSAIDTCLALAIPCARRIAVARVPVKVGRAVARRRGRDTLVEFPE